MVTCNQIASRSKTGREGTLEGYSISQLEWSHVTSFLSRSKPRVRWAFNPWQRLWKTIKNGVLWECLRQLDREPVMCLEGAACSFGWEQTVRMITCNRLLSRSHPQSTRADNLKFETMKASAAFRDSFQVNCDTTCQWPSATTPLHISWSTTWTISIRPKTVRELMSTKLRNVEILKFDSRKFCRT